MLKRELLLNELIDKMIVSVLSMENQDLYTDGYLAALDNIKEAMRVYQSDEQILPS